MITKSCTSAPGVSRSEASMSPSGTSAKASQNANSVMLNDSSVNIAVAKIFALMMISRDTGVASSGSSDWRSRSPAVASIASCMPPMNAKQQQQVGQ